MQESGAWTPTSFFGNISHYERCTWQRIGNVVHFQGSIYYRDATNDYFFGLPFHGDSDEVTIICTSIQSSIGRSMIDRGVVVSWGSGEPV